MRKRDVPNLVRPSSIPPGLLQSLAFGGMVAEGTEKEKIDSEALLERTRAPQKAHGNNS